MEVFRICQELYANDLSGNGSRLFGGRWNEPGVFALYTAQHRSLALLETLVHVPVFAMKDKVYVLMSIQIPDDVSMKTINHGDLEDGWDAFDLQPVTKAIGNDFFSKGTDFILKVPSVLMPEEFNFILNPLLPAMREVKIAGKRRLDINDRLISEI